MADNTKQERSGRYQLYLMPLSNENIQLAAQFRFNRINSQYILVYTDILLPKVKNTRYHIIDEKEVHRLSDSEKAWLLESNVTIITEESVKKQEDILNSFGERLNRLEQELRKEAEKIGENSGKADG